MWRPSRRSGSARTRLPEPPTTAADSIPAVRGATAPRIPPRWSLRGGPLHARAGAVDPTAETRNGGDSKVSPFDELALLRQLRGWLSSAGECLARARVHVLSWVRRPVMVTVRPEDGAA